GIRDGHVTGVQTCALPILSRDALARVAHRELEIRACGPEPQLDAPVLGREVDRVREEVPRHLLEALRVAPDRVDPRMDCLHDARSEERRVGKEWRARVPTE